MKSSLLLSRSLPVLALTILLTGLAHRTVSVGQPTLVVKPFLLDEVRALVNAAAQVFVYNPAAKGESIRLTSLEVRADGVLIERQDLDLTLPGDPDYGRTSALIERLPSDLVHRHDERRYFADPDAAEFDGPDALRVLQEVRQQVVALNERYSTRGVRPFGHVDFVLPLDQVFFPDDAPGTSVMLQVAVDWTGPDGGRRTSLLNRRLTWLGPAPGLPPGFLTGNSTASVHRGDLHVHTCHGEALGACAPSENCTAETFQVSGSFSIAQLKTQYQALGMDWFTATDHSYCINSDSEYSVIAGETSAATDSSFLCIPDTELSSDEAGPQHGSDIGDILCKWTGWLSPEGTSPATTQANHMGAHGISSRMPGGGDGLFGFCNSYVLDVLAGFQENIATIRAQGGYAIANHPAASSFSWESRQDTVGIEGDGLHGVEIWNGGSRTGQDGDVKDWVDWLLAGRLLYAYSGSDTHNQAFNFGANHVLLDGAFTTSELEAAIQAGSLYISNGPALIIETDLGGSTLPMGAMYTLPDPVPGATATVRVHYDFGADTGTLSVFRGRSGDAAETQIFTSAVLSGSGFIEIADPLPTTATSWYRAYAENSAATNAAYTNPIFFIRGSGDVFTYCTAKTTSIGCAPALGWSGMPSATSGAPFFITASQVQNLQFGILVYSHGSDFLPFAGGTLCLAFPLHRVATEPTGGSSSGQDCTGVLSHDFNSWIASGNDAGLTAGATAFAQWWFRDPGAATGSGLTDALQFTIQP